MRVQATESPHDRNLVRDIVKLGTDRQGIDAYAVPVTHCSVSELLRFLCRVVKSVVEDVVVVETVERVASSSTQ